MYNLFSKKSLGRSIWVYSNLIATSLIYFIFNIKIQDDFFNKFVKVKRVKYKCTTMNTGFPMFE